MAAHLCRTVGGYQSGRNHTGHNRHAGCRVRSVYLWLIERQHLYLHQRESGRCRRASNYPSQCPRPERCLENQFGAPVGCTGYHWVTPGKYLRYQFRG